MIMPPQLRKFILNVHISLSVGWIGAVLAFLVLVISALNSQEARTLRAIWVAMGLIDVYVIVPLALASLFTGIIISLGSKWGLFRHYWVLFSLLLTIFACTILLINMQTVNYFARMATEIDNSNLGQLREALRTELFHASLGLVVLLLIQALNVYKPRGMTPYGWRKRHE